MRKSNKRLNRRRAASMIETLESRRLMASAVGLIVNNDATTYLARFEDSAPGAITSVTQVTGLQMGETLLAIDYRPITGTLYGLGSGSRLYALNARTGAATQVGADFAVALRGDSFDMDFNPTVDRIRVVSNADQNLRLNPDTGAVVDSDTVAGGLQEDAALAYDAGDAMVGDDPIVVAAAYTKNLAGSTVTTLFGLDAGSNTLVRQGGVDGPPSPNAGGLFTVGPLGVDIGKRSSLDIATTGSTESALAMLQVVGSSVPQLYSINLTTGSATLVGAAGIKRITDFAIAPPTKVAIALTSGSRLIAFDAADPNVLLRNVKIRGLAAGESLRGLDFRPATGQLYALSSEDRLYIVNPKNGRTTAVGSDFALALNGSSFGFDFNPTVDRIRAVSDADQNLRLNPDTGAVVDSDTVTGGLQADGTLAYDTDTDGSGADTGDVNAGANPVVTAAAYTFNDASADTATTLFGIDSGLNVLVRQDPPNAGTLNTVGSLGININNNAGFDIVTRDGNNYGLAALQPDGQTRSGLYGVNLISGAAIRIGTIGGGRSVLGVAFV